MIILSTEINYLIVDVGNLKITCTYYQEIIILYLVVYKICFSRTKINICKISDRMYNSMSANVTISIFTIII